MNLPVRVPGLIQLVYPDRIWKINEEGKKLYLTFDDGPHPEITRLVLNLLNQYNAKATFFCIGKRVEQYPEVLQEIKAQGSALGNHSYSHRNGWKTSTPEYVEDVCKAKSSIDSNLFRAPYGRLKKSQAFELRKRGFKVIMWTILSQDYDIRLSPAQCSSRSVDQLRSGDIILFHDSEKAKLNMLAALEAVLVWGRGKGFAFENLDFLNSKSG